MWGPRAQINYSRMATPIDLVLFLLKWAWLETKSLLLSLSLAGPVGPLCRAQNGPKLSKLPVSDKNWFILVINGTDLHGTRMVMRRGKQTKK